jgi:hypothetical protein
MIRRSMCWAALVAVLLPFSACTCSEEAPPPPKTAERPSGFGAMITPRKAPEQIPGQLAQAPTPQGAPTLPPAPTVSQSNVPDNFPEGIPIPDGSKVVGVQNLANDAKSVIFTADQDSPELFNLYRDTMKKSGWGDPTQQYQGKDQSFLSFKKDDTVTNVSVSKDPKTGQRIVAVMYYQEKPLPFPEF